MNTGGPQSAFRFGGVVARYSLGWMLAANLVGVWLAVSLLWPEAGEWLAPLTYGRWMPVHLNWQLYGGCALPLVGVLLAWCFDGRHPQVVGHARVALGAWSLALALGGVAWLGGTTSGKLFLDWHGWTRLLLPAAMHVVWALLAAHTWWRWRELDRVGRVARGLVLGLLLGVPSVLQWAAGREVYPAVNPDSGGATGAALLGSTLGIVTIYLALPALLGLGRVGLARKNQTVAEAVRLSRPSIGETSLRLASARPPKAGSATTVSWTGHSRGDFFGLALRARSRPILLGVALGASWLVFALIDHGHTSHHAPTQIAALAVLMVWIPLLPAGWAGYAWPEAARPWRRAAAVWWALLVLSGWVTFLPAWSEALKFTHGLVAHAHLAMAGFVTSVNGAILVVLAGRAAPRGVFWLWQGGCAVFVGAMLVLGGREAEQVAELFRHEGWVHGLLALRLLGGLAMLAASVRWLTGYFRA